MPELVADYVESVIRDYNTLIPHSALEGGTPYEIFNGEWGESQLLSLQEKHKEIMNERKNYSFTCEC